MPDLNPLPQRLRAIAAQPQPVCVLIALGSLMALALALDRPGLVIPLFLGAIASALAETDDSWPGRLRTQGVMLFCFAAVAYAVAACFAYPWAMVALLAGATFGLTLMAAIEARYRSIGFASLVLAVYALIRVDGPGASAAAAQQEPALLLAGAAWYGLISIIAAAAFPLQPVQLRLASLFSSLSGCLKFKASLFEPVKTLEVERKRLTLAHLNAEVVGELNASKYSLNRRIGAATAGAQIERYRGLYLIAQDVHERATSSHDDYEALAQAFFHSDLLYRCQRVLALQGAACGELARSITRHEPFVMNSKTVRALAELQSAITHRRNHAAAAAEHDSLLASVEALADNLARLDGQLASAAEPSALAGRTDVGLSDEAPQHWRARLARVRLQVAQRSVLFRHAVRLAVALTAGYGVMRWIHPAQGYWILLTTLFVCQQSYGDTIARLAQRSVGTVAGVVIGWALLRLFPQPMLQAFIAVAAGVVFFSTRLTRYRVATAAITVLVLMCFNRVGDSGVLIVPRLFDTAVGCLIAGLSMLLVLPQWQSRRFSELAAAAMRGHADYLMEIARQYGDGHQDDLAYRIARRQAHDADAALSLAVVDMYREPDRTRPHAGTAMRFLMQSHTLMSYLSALGAHRVATLDPALRTAFSANAAAAATALRGLAALLAGGPVAARPDQPPCAVPDAPADPVAQLMRTELRLIGSQIGVLERHAHEWLDQAGDAKRGA